MSIRAVNAYSLIKINPFIKEEESAKILNLDFTISLVTANSSLCRPGALFVATVGATKESRDGHDYVDEAIANGASLVVVNQDYVQKKPYSVPVVLSRDSKLALCHLSEAFHDFPSTKLKIIGITGTNGKTSTSFLLHSILKQAGFTPKVMGTLGMGDPANLVALTHTTMPPEFVSAHLASMVEDGVSHVIMEVSSHALHLRRVEAIKFCAVALTNITEDHLDFHGSLKAYQDAKSRLFFELAQEDTIKVLPAKHPFRNLAATFFGEGLDNAVSFFDARMTQHGVEFLLKIDGQDHKIMLPIFGCFQAINACLAAALAKELGISLLSIRKGLLCCPNIPGRLEPIPNDAHKLVFVDFAHTPDALHSLLRSLRLLTKGRILLVFGCGGNRDVLKRPQMGRIAEELADFVIVTDDNPRHEDPKAIRRSILGGMKNPARALEISDRREAISRAITEALPRDVVVIAGKGHENYQIYNNTAVAFSDRLEAKKVMKLL